MNVREVRGYAFEAVGAWLEVFEKRERRIVLPQSESSTVSLATVSVPVEDREYSATSVK